MRSAQLGNHQEQRLVAAYHVERLRLPLPGLGHGLVEVRYVVYRLAVHCRYDIAGPKTLRPARAALLDVFNDYAFNLAIARHASLDIPDGRARQRGPRAAGAAGGTGCRGSVWRRANAYRNIPRAIAVGDLQVDILADRRKPDPVPQIRGAPQRASV